MQQPSDSNADAEACSSCDALPDADVISNDGSFDDDHDEDILPDSDVDSWGGEKLSLLCVHIGSDCLLSVFFNTSHTRAT
jgi:hypothetical protein